MFEFIKKAIFAGLTILSRGNPLSAAPLSVAPLNHNKKMFLNMTTSIKQQVINVNGKYQRN